MFRLEVEAETYLELLNKIKNIIPELSLDQKQVLTKATETAKSQANLDTPAKKKRGRPKKQTKKQEEEEKPSEKSEKEEQEQAEKSEEILREVEPSLDKMDVDRDTVKKYLQEVTTMQGMPLARKLLAKYMAKKISDLKPEHFGPLYLDCKQALSQPESEAY